MNVRLHSIPDDQPKKFQHYNPQVGESERAFLERVFPPLIEKVVYPHAKKCSNLLSGPYAVEDLAQESAVRIFKKWKRFHIGKYSTHVWATTIAIVRNTALILARKQKHEFDADVFAIKNEDGIVQEGMYTLTCLQKLQEYIVEINEEYRDANKEELGALWVGIIDRILTPVQRKAFILNRIEGMSYLRIAEELGVSESTVNARICAAKNKIHLHIQEQ